jgi:membrane-bound lytic murein transglycosylase MltF
MVTATIPHINDYDWLMIAAMAFQESGIDQQVISPARAVGVMQVILIPTSGSAMLKSSRPTALAGRQWNT